MATEITHDESPGVRIRGPEEVKKVEGHWWTGIIACSFELEENPAYW